MQVILPHFIPLTKFILIIKFDLSESLKNGIMITRQLNILIQLATIDGHLAGKEKKLIEHLAKVNNIDEEVIKQLLNQPEPIADLDHLSEEERFEYLYMVIQLMKVDGQRFVTGRNLSLLMM